MVYSRKSYARRGSRRVVSARGSRSRRALSRPTFARGRTGGSRQQTVRLIIQQAAPQATYQPGVQGVVGFASHPAAKKSTL